jgi:hypothetical protein
MTTFLGLLCLGIVFGFLVPPVFACRRQIVQPSDEAMRVDFRERPAQINQPADRSLSEY